MPARARKGQTRPREGIHYQNANKLPVSNQRLPKILDGWHLLGGSQPEISFPEETQGAPGRRAWKLRLWLGRGEVALHLKRVCSSKNLAAWAAWTGNGKKRQAQLNLSLCGVTQNLDLSVLDLGSARNSGPTPCRATCSLRSVDRESTHAASGGKPSVAGTLWALPTQASDLSAVFLPPHSRTEQVNLNKRPPPPPCVRAEIRHWGDL